MDKTFWKSLGEKYQAKEFQEKALGEFQSSPFKEKQSDDQAGNLARRQFLKLMGASLALSTASCVRRPVETVIPYNKRPFEVIPGRANYYASSFFDGKEVVPVLVKTLEGRPLHIEGYGDGPLGRSGLSPRVSAQILSLYDPDRLRTPVVNSQDPKKRGNKISISRPWEFVDKKIVEQLSKGSVRVLTSGSRSLSFKKLLGDFCEKVGADLTHWSPLNWHDIYEAQKLSYGEGVIPQYRYDRASVIVSVDGDFLGGYRDAMESEKNFIKGRNPEDPSHGGMSRLISFQSVPSLTSLNADENHSIRPSDQLPLILNMIHELVFVLGQSCPVDRKALLSLVHPHKKAHFSVGLSHEKFSSLVKKLSQNKGRSLVVACGVATRSLQGLSLQVAVNLINSILDNDGQTVWHKNSLTYEGESDEGVKELMEDMSRGRVKTLIVDGLNPMYSLPDSQGFKKALNSLDMLISTSNWMDETACLANVVVPRGHSMENWGDLQWAPGLELIQQPTIEPLYKTRSFEDSLIVWARGLGHPLSPAENYGDLLVQSWKKRLGGEKAWFDFLQRGYVGSPVERPEPPRSFKSSALKQIQVVSVAFSGKPSSKEDLELVLYSKVSIHDGDMANVSWLQELPDPVTKICWDNYLIISPQLSQTHGLKEGDEVEVQSSSNSMKLPVYIHPGQSPHVVGVALGYGRREGGELLKGVGFDVTDFIQWKGKRMIYSGSKVEIRKTGACYPLAQTQDHHNMEGRHLAVETTEKEYKKNHGLGFHPHKVFSLWKGYDDSGHKWGLAVDLNSCTGCSACVISCQSENNIPVVGKANVLKGRQMHWIRIDRYYSGDENKSVNAIFQPVMCQHCENAPCETVCPVLATVHSDEGLNDMVYNRCVGTRYCANNCPYKVRRFNWFYYDQSQDPLYMALNPDVTVRTRGVMEKCTFCVQRIKEGKNKAQDEDRPLKDGDIQTACQSACPTGAIVFGDFNDKKSRLSQWAESHRAYNLLEELNVVPRVRYLGKIRNTDGESPPPSSSHSSTDQQGGAGGERIPSLVGLKGQEA